MSHIIFKLSFVFSCIYVYRSVCRKQELTQLELEKAEDLIASRTQQREQLVS